MILPQREISLATNCFMPSGEGLTCGSAPSLVSVSVTAGSLMISRILLASLSTIGFGTLPVVVTVCQEAVS